MPSIGKTALTDASNPLFLIDESLDWNVAKALRLVEYNTTTVYETFPRRSGVKDPEIIAWCGNNDAIWVHADDRARKEHKKEIVTSRIRFIWVYRPGGVMSSKEQLRILSYILSDVTDRLEKQPRQLHYKVSAHGQAPRKRIKLEPLSLVL
jgi:hypothetical protein